MSGSGKCDSQLNLAHARVDLQVGDVDRAIEGEQGLRDYGRDPEDSHVPWSRG